MTNRHGFHICLSPLMSLDLHIHSLYSIQSLAGKDPRVIFISQLLSMPDR